ncbi:MAG: UbiA family prenyltransferase, partial [Acidiferrobacterales bacterium]
MNWRVALRLGRISNLPTVWTNVLTGVVLCGGVDAPTPVLSVALISLSLFYVAGMYLNDAFDRDIDAHERPERPIPSGLVAAQTVFAIGFGMLTAALVLLMWAGYGLEGGTGWRAPTAGLALAAAIVFYDWHHKDNPLSPVIMGLCRMLVYVTAGLAVTTTLPLPLIVAAGIVLCYLIGLTYIAKQENLARVRGLWPLIFLLVPFAYTLPAAVVSLTGIVLYVCFVTWVVFALSFLVRPGGVDIPRAVVSLLAGICLLDALLIAGHGE